MADISKITLPSNNTYDIKDATARSKIAFYGTCSTAANTAAKIATLDNADNFSLTAGTTVNIKFANSNSASDPTLNVNGIGAKDIVQGGLNDESLIRKPKWDSNSIVSLTYDGTKWFITNSLPLQLNDTGAGITVWQNVASPTTYTISHSNSVTAQTTQAVYPIKIDAQGHITAYGSAVTIPSAVAVKGNAESSYRTGNVNLTPANIGAVATSGNESVSGNKTFTGTTTLTNNSVYGVNTNDVVKVLANGIIQSPIPKYLWHDLFAFCKVKVPAYYTTTNGTTWTSATLNKKLFIHKQMISKVDVISSSISGSRWVWSGGGYAYCNGAWLVLGVAYSATIAKFDILLEASGDNFATTTTLCNVTGASINQQPVWIKTGSPSVNDIRLTITRNSASDNTTNLPLVSIMWLTYRWGDQGKGSELEYPYDWDADSNVTFPAKVNASSYNLATTTVGSASAGTAIAADDITAWTTNTPTAVTKKTVVTSATFNTVVTGGSTTSITPVTKKTVVTSASGATAAYANGVLTITNGSFGTGDSVTTGTAVNAYTSLTTGSSGSATTGDSVTVTAGTAASLSYTARSIPNISVSNKTVATGSTT